MSINDSTFTEWRQKLIELEASKGSTALAYFNEDELRAYYNKGLSPEQAEVLIKQEVKLRRGQVAT